MFAQNPGLLFSFAAFGYAIAPNYLQNNVPVKVE